MQRESPRKAGEMEYVLEPSPSNGMSVPVRIFADSALMQKMLSDRTIMQAANVASMPGIVGHGVVLPDGHEGYGFPVGGVAAMDAEEGMISPGGVGYDINCGVRLLRVNLTEEELRPRLKNVVLDLFNAVPSGVGAKGTVKLSRSQLDEVMVRGVRWAIDNGYGTQNDADACEESGTIPGADPGSVSERAAKRGILQLGSLGSGNHFLEIQKVAEIYDEKAAARMGIRKGQATVLVHCGSRGFGHQICSDYLRVSEQALTRLGIKLKDRELACVPNASEEGESYRSAMFAALNFAWSNRQMITHWIRRSFERVFGQAESDLGMDPDIRCIPQHSKDRRAQCRRRKEKSHSPQKGRDQGVSCRNGRNTRKVQGSWTACIHTRIHGNFQLDSFRTAGIHGSHVRVDSTRRRKSHVPLKGKEAVYGRRNQKAAVREGRFCKVADKERRCRRGSAGIQGRRQRG